MHVSNLGVSHAIKGSAGILLRIARPARREIAGALDVGQPEVLLAHAMACPANHRSASGRPLIVLTWPLVVLARHLVQHAGTHLALDAIPGKLVVDHARQREPGTGTFAALVQDRGHFP